MNKITEILATMEYGPAPEASDHVKAWLAGHKDGFKHFIGGRFTAPVEKKWFDVNNPADGSLLGRVAQGGKADVNAAVKAARTAFKTWSKLSGDVRARHLYALARHVQKRERFLAVLETMDNGKPIRESRDIDIPLVARHFYHHAGWAALIESEFPHERPVGVAGQIIPWNFPLLMLAWKIAPALAAGNTVVLKPAEFTPLTALAFAEICAEAGLPAGVVNIVTGDGETGALIVDHDGIHKIAFTGSTEVGRKIRVATAGRARSFRWNSAASHPSSCSTMPISTVWSRAWSMRSGSTRARFAAPARAPWFRKAWRRISTPSCAPAWRRSASAIRSTRRSTWAPSWHRCNSNGSRASSRPASARAPSAGRPRRRFPARACSIRRRCSPMSSRLRPSPRWRFSAPCWRR